MSNTAHLSTSDIDAELHSLGTPYVDGDGDVWLEVVEGLFRFVILTADGFRLGAPATRSEVESDCGRLVPMTD